MAEENTPETSAPFDPATADDAALSAEYERIRTRGQELAAKADLSAEEASELSQLASQATAVGAELDARAQRVEEQNAARESFASLPERSIPAPAPVATPQPSAEEPAAPAAPKETPQVPSVAEMSAQALPAPTGPTASAIKAFVSNDAAGHVGKSVGDEFTGLTEISEALIRSAQQYGRVGGGSRGATHAIAQFRRERGAEFTVERPEDGLRVLQHARSEARLHGGSLAKQWQHNIDQGASLTAAAGWCAPSENRYDLCRLWGAGIGLVDLPTLTVRRGGINYTSEPTFAEIYANAVAAGGGSNFLTEAEVIANTAKTCSVIPCPDFVERRLDVMALCIRVSFLQAAGYPELVNLWTDGLLAAHEQEMNRIILAAMIAQAGAATVFANPAIGDDSFTAALLAAVEMAREDLIYQQMMPFGSTMEVILPHWVLPQIRADLSRRPGDTGSLLRVTDSQIASLFSTRGVRVQFVRGWQDGLITGGALDPAFPGGDDTTPFMTSLPQSVNFLVYPAGAVTVARQDVVNLTNVYDSASLAQNEFTALFAEEGFAPIFPCPGLRQYTVNGCVAGPTGYQSTACTQPVVLATAPA